jgi:hypothetical protein
MPDRDTNDLMILQSDIQELLRTDPMAQLRISNIALSRRVAELTKELDEMRIERAKAMVEVQKLNGKGREKVPPVEEPVEAT